MKDMKAMKVLKATKDVKAKKGIKAKTFFFGITEVKGQRLGTKMSKTLRGAGGWKVRFRWVQSTIVLRLFVGGAAIAV